MDRNTVVLKQKIKFWWIIFGIFQILLLILIISSLSVPSWTSYFDKSLNVSIFYYNSFNNVEIFRTFEGTSFKGSLTTCLNGCDDHDSYYSSLSKDWCNHDIKNIYYGSEYSSKISSICSLFVSLTASAAVFVVFEILTILTLTCWHIAMMCSTRVYKCFLTGCCCSICSCVSHSIGTLFWFTVTGASFSGCNSFPLDGRAPDICATSGPALALVVMILYPIGLICYLFVFSRLYAKRKEFGVIRVDNFTGEQGQFIPALPIQPLPGYFIPGVPYAPAAGVGELYMPYGGPAYQQVPQNISMTEEGKVPPVAGNNVSEEIKENDIREEECD